MLRPDCYIVDAEGNPVRVDDRRTPSFTYDALNERVRSDWGSDAQEFVYNLNGQRVSLWDSNSGTKTQRQTWWGSVPVVFSFPSGDHYQHQNSLGTERMRTTYSGAVEATFYATVRQQILQFQLR